ncbi:MAG TPA: DMT family transporter [Thermoplasmata archaeon]|nr:DMT family transporter [Thermoplasmata archaeon]
MFGNRATNAANAAPNAAGTRTGWLGVGLLLVLATAVISGVSTFVNLYAVSGTNSAAFVTARNGAVALILLPFAVVAAGASWLSLRRQDWGRLLAIGIVGGGIPFLLFFRGLELASAAHGGITASFLYRTLFLMATVLGVVYLRERFDWRIALGAGLLLAGNFLLLNWTSVVWTDGSLYVLAATAMWAVEYSISKRALRDLPSPTVALGRMGIGALFLFGYLTATSQVGSVAALSAGQWTWVGISAALLCAFVATWYAGLKRVNLSVATAVLVLGFPVSWLLSAATARAPATFWEAVGAGAIVLGVVAAAGLEAWRASWEFLKGLPHARPTA